MPTPPDRRRLLPLMLLAFVLLLPGFAAADIVLLKDGTRFLGVVTHNGEDGVTVRSGGNDWAFWRRDVALVKLDHSTRSHERRTPAQPRATAKTAVAVAGQQDAHVVVYGTSWCGYCARARTWFREHQIAFEDRDIDHDDAARDEVSRKCAEAGEPFNGSIPVIDVNGSIIHGFDVRGIESALRGPG